MKRSHPSGAQKRKRKREFESQIQKIAKIQSFFKPEGDDKSEDKPDAGTSASVFDSGEPSSHVDPQVSSGSPNANDAEEASEIKHQLTTEFSPDEVLKFEFPTDMGHYPEKLTDQMKRFVFGHGLCRPEGPFPRNDQNRCFSSHFYGEITSKKTQFVPVGNTWLCYSQKLNVVYCQYCWLFPTDSRKFETCNWQGLSKKVKEHAMSRCHIQSCMIGNQWRQEQTVDHGIDVSLTERTKFWREILRRLVEIILTIARNNIAFRGTCDEIGAVSNGNFLSQVELLAKFDVPMNTLLSKKKHSVKYLSPKIQNELIKILAARVRHGILDDIKDARYFSIIVDTTQDCSKQDQLSFILRYTLINEEIQVNEAFINFYHIHDQTSEGLETAILSYLKEHSIDIKHCRGQGYDGAANMSGSCQGLQKRLTNIQPNAFYVHCAAHSLNLVVNDAVKEVIEVKKFFDVVQQMYVFFGYSISRWDILAQITSESEVTLKSLNPTRWSGRVKSLIAVRLRYVDILQALSRVILQSTKKDTVHEAKSLKGKFENFEFILILTLLTDVLSVINTASKLLQAKDIDMSKAVSELDTVLMKMKSYRNEFDGLFRKSEEIAQRWSISPVLKEKRKSSVKFEDQLSPERIFKVNVYNAVVDIIIHQIETRFTGMKKLASLFKVVTPTSLLEMNEDDLSAEAAMIVQIYPEDISNALATELLLLRSSMNDKLVGLTSVRQLATCLLVDYREVASSFPNICTHLRIFLTIPVTVASAERSFSKLKLIKNYLRTSMCQERLQGLAVLSIEAERARQIDFEQVINDFAVSKARKASFL